MLVSVVALVVSVIAAGVSGWSVWYSRQQATAATSADRRARTPALAVEVEQRVEPGADGAIYVVRNDGPQALDSVVLVRPITDDQITYPVAVTGETDWQDQVDLGPLGLAHTRRFTLSLGSAERLPAFRVTITCRAGEDEWTLVRLLDPPRKPRGGRVIVRD